PEQKMRLGLVGREEERALEFRARLLIVSLIEEPARPLQVEGGHVALVALSAFGNRAVDALHRGGFESGLHSFEAARGGVDRLGGKLRGQLSFARRFSRG